MFCLVFNLVIIIQYLLLLPINIVIINFEIGDVIELETIIITVVLYKHLPQFLHKLFILFF